MRFTHIVWPGIVLGAVALGIASYVQYAPRIDRDVADRYDGLARDPIERLGLDAERDLQETREIAGRARTPELSDRRKGS